MKPEQKKSSIDFLHGFDEVLARVALLVSFVEKLCANDALFIQHKSGRKRNSFKAARGLPVANAISVDGFAPFVGQQREREFVPGRGTFQYLRRVVADARQDDSGRGNFLQVRLQLN